MDGINYFDVIVLALITIIGLKGILRGFIKELFSLIGLVGGVYVASRTAYSVGELLKTPLGLTNDNTISLLGFILSLVGFWVLTYVLGIIVSKAFQLSGLGIFDRFLGLVFGIGKVFFLFSIIVYTLSNFKSLEVRLNRATKTSVVYPILKETGNYIVKLDTTKLQNNLSKKLNTSIESTKKIMNDVTDDVINQQINKRLNNNEK